MVWSYKIYDDRGNVVSKSKRYRTSTEARKSAHRRLHKSDIPTGSYSEVSKTSSKNKTRTKNKTRKKSIFSF